MPAWAWKIQRLTVDVRPAAKHGLPDPVADDDRLRSALGFEISGVEAADQRMDAEDVEEMRIDAGKRWHPGSHVAESRTAPAAVPQRDLRARNRRRPITRVSGRNRNTRLLPALVAA